MAVSQRNRLAEVEERLAWADKHLNSLYAECVQFLAKPWPYEITSERKTDGTTVKDVFSLHILEDPPPQISLVLSDVLHSLRATLDNIAFALAESHAFHLTSNMRRDSSFPIAETIEGFDPKKVRAVKPEVFTIIEQAQPYHRSNPALHPLAVLRRLSNLDKHQALHLTYLQLVSAGVWGELGYMTDFRIGPFKDDTEILTFVWNIPPDPEMKVDPQIAIHIGLDEVGGPEQATVICKAIIKFVRTEVLEPLRPYF
jgi:hypothetical protein